MSFRPRKNNVIVKVLEVNETTEGGIFLPETTEGVQQKKAEVISFGEEVKELNIGEIVVFNAYKNTKIGEFTVIHEDDIIVVEELQ